MLVESGRIARIGGAPPDQSSVCDRRREWVTGPAVAGRHDIQMSVEDQVRTGRVAVDSSDNIRSSWRRLRPVDSPTPVREVVRQVLGCKAFVTRRILGGYRDEALCQVEQPAVVDGQLRLSDRSVSRQAWRLPG